MSIACLFTKPTLAIGDKDVKQPITIQASNFVRGVNVALDECGDYGSGVLLNASPCNSQANAAEFDFDVSSGGKYKLFIEYASAQSRPVKIFLNGKKIINNGLAATTGCWEEQCQKSKLQGIIKLKSGENILKLQRSDVFPHIRTITLLPI